MDAPAKEKNDIPVDLLGRQEIVDRIMKILEVISEKKSSCTFALNGAWGTGKTFVLNMLMNQLWEYHSDKYIVFHYNCWQYDYYEEPLIAIVAAMLDSVDEESHLLPAHLRDKAKAGMELAKPVLQKIATDFVKNKIGVDLTEVVSSAKAYQDALDGEEQKKADARLFDEFYSFKKAIHLAQEEIRKLSKDRTLVMVVDELDRCLPSYAIKVLERLHHLFAEVANSALILAIDKKQLDRTILGTFGDNTDTTKYLRKFINFEITLDIGSISGSFREKYHDYFDFFDESLIPTEFPYDEFLASLFSGIDARKQEQIMNRIKTVHRILFTDEKLDYTFMCYELLTIVFQEVCGVCSTVSFSTENNKLHERLRSFIDEHWGNDLVYLQEVHSGIRNIYLVRGSELIPMALLYYIYSLSPYDGSLYYLSEASAIRAYNEWTTVIHSNDPDAAAYHKIESNLQYLKLVVNFLNIIQ